MEKTFRQILSENLQRGTHTAGAPAAAESASTETVYTLNFTWTAPSTSTLRPLAHAKYSASAPAPAAPPPPPPQPEEPLIPVSQLLDSEQFLVQRLVRYGATELADGVSRARLKKAYRYLVKRLHPDVSPGTAAQFREVRSAYQALLKASALACGNGSASGSESRRPSAA